jgi:hypothetical protein
VQVSYSEGLANHTGPESCVGIREDVGEALTGERIGQPSSRESLIFPDADVVEITEGNMGSAKALCTGTGRPRVWPADGHRRSASGRRGVVADDARTRGV